MEEGSIDVYLDDLRQPPDGWVLVATGDEVKRLLLEKKVRRLSLDHDLGCCADCLKAWIDHLNNTTFRVSAASPPAECSHIGTGYDLVCWMEETGNWPKLKPTVHSANPAGAARMRQVIDKHYGPHQNPDQRQSQDVSE